jgi:hypothetical protein
MHIHDLAFKVVNSSETPPELSAQLNGHSRLVPGPQLDHELAVERIGNPK